MIGAENWHQVDGEKWPYNAIIYLEIKGEGGCSGAMIGPYTVLTAGHCVKKGNTQEMVDPASITAYSGRKGSAISAKGVDILYLKTGKDNYTSGEYDFATVILSKPIGDKTGYLGARATDLRLGSRISLVGFPGNKEKNNPWVSPGEITCLSDKSFCHNADSQPGSSGSPIFLNSQFQRGNYQIVAVHVNSKDATNNGDTSSNSDLLFCFIYLCHNKRPPHSGTYTSQKPQMSDEEALRTLQQQLHEQTPLQTTFL